ncbi:hypothetical protein IGB42_04135 [Andreprevotia sp. IGB-42]|uniref:hypothetical protein n=1 Tax=Andreprevotia sp. IGB-42 TaxID=2497473 RepID=UPI001356ADD4|nr:hypothetical protein [Andreprevotia sp. IGB-42]KAF0811369.1 hypothetical protein IGB42_04135 [Andreprevotia sp. IGB-42]
MSNVQTPLFTMDQATPARRGRGRPPANIDWIALQADYAAGLCSVRKLAAQYGISEAAVRNNAIRHGWLRVATPARGNAGSVAANDTLRQLAHAATLAGMVSQRCPKALVDSVSALPAAEGLADAADASAADIAPWLALPPALSMPGATRAATQGNAAVAADAGSASPVANPPAASGNPPLVASNPPASNVPASDEDSEDTQRALRISRHVLIGLEKAATAGELDPRDAKIMIDTAQKAIETIRRLRGLDEAPAGGSLYSEQESETLAAHVLAELERSHADTD